MIKRAKAPVCEPPAAHDERIKAALNLWLAPHPTMSVVEMAAAVKQSPEQFSDLFVRTTGMLPLEFLAVLKDYRVELARAVEVLSKVGSR
jgi:transcriptional regulator GlxA family with amidase domain